MSLAVLADIQGVLKRYTVLLSMASSRAVVHPAGVRPPRPSGVFAGAVVYGVYLGTIIPYLQTSLSGLVHPYRRTYALSILSMAMFAGQACVVGVRFAWSKSVIGPSARRRCSRSCRACSSCCSSIVLVYLLATRKNAAYPYGDVTE